jgi:hypothetical protein
MNIAEHGKKRKEKNTKTGVVSVGQMSIIKKTSFSGISGFL